MSGKGQNPDNLEGFWPNSVSLGQIFLNLEEFSAGVGWCLFVPGGVEFFLIGPNCGKFKQNFLKFEAIFSRLFRFSGNFLSFIWVKLKIFG